MGVEAKPVNAGQTFNIEVKIRRNGTFNSVKVSDGIKWRERYMDRGPECSVFELFEVAAEMFKEIYREKRDER